MDAGSASAVVLRLLRPDVASKAIHKAHDIDWASPAEFRVHLHNVPFDDYLDMVNSLTAREKAHLIKKTVKKNEKEHNGLHRPPGGIKKKQAKALFKTLGFGNQGLAFNDIWRILIGMEPKSTHLGANPGVFKGEVHAIQTAVQLRVGNDNANMPKREAMSFDSGYGASPRPGEQHASTSAGGPKRNGKPEMDETTVRDRKRKRRSSCDYRHPSESSSVKPSGIWHQPGAGVYAQHDPVAEPATLPESNKRQRHRAPRSYPEDQRLRDHAIPLPAEGPQHEVSPRQEISHKLEDVASSLDIPASVTAVRSQSRAQTASEEMHPDTKRRRERRKQERKKRRLLQGRLLKRQRLLDGATAVEAMTTGAPLHKQVSNAPSPRCNASAVSTLPPHIGQTVLLPSPVKQWTAPSTVQESSTKSLPIVGSIRDLVVNPPVEHQNSVVHSICMDDGSARSASPSRSEPTVEEENHSGQTSGFQDSPSDTYRNPPRQSLSLQAFREFTEAAEIVNPIELHRPTYETELFSPSRPESYYTAAEFLSPLKNTPITAQSPQAETATPVTLGLDCTSIEPNQLPADSEREELFTHVSQRESSHSVYENEDFVTGSVQTKSHSPPNTNPPRKSTGPREQAKRVWYTGSNQDHFPDIKNALMSLQGYLGGESDSDNSDSSDTSSDDGSGIALQQHDTSPEFTARSVSVEHDGRPYQSPERVESDLAATIAFSDIQVSDDPAVSGSVTALPMDWVDSFMAALDNPAPEGALTNVELLSKVASQQQAPEARGLEQHIHVDDVPSNEPSRSASASPTTVALKDIEVQPKVRDDTLSRGSSPSEVYQRTKSATNTRDLDRSDGVRSESPHPESERKSINGTMCSEEAQAMVSSQLLGEAGLLCPESRSAWHVANRVTVQRSESPEVILYRTAADIGSSGPDREVQSETEARCTPPRSERSPSAAPVSPSRPDSSPLDELSHSPSPVHEPEGAPSQDGSVAESGQQRKRKRKVTDKVSGHFDTPSPAKKARVPAGTSTAAFPELSATSFGLIQEELASDPYRLLIAVTFLNKTTGRAAIPIYRQLMEAYPAPEDLAKAEVEDLAKMIYHLGFQNQRARKLIRLATAWTAQPPEKGRRYRTRDYPQLGDGRSLKPNDVVEEDATDCSGALEIGHLYGCGPYAWDSWRIFCRDVLRGVARGYNGEGTGAAGEDKAESFEPEWKRVVPLDKELRACLRWMWLRDGWIWDPLTGRKTLASPETMEKAAKGETEWHVPDGREDVQDHPAFDSTPAQSQQAEFEPSRAEDPADEPINIPQTTETILHDVDAGAQSDIEQAGEAFDVGESARDQAEATPAVAAGTEPPGKNANADPIWDVRIETPRNSVERDAHSTPPRTSVATNTRRRSTRRRSALRDVEPRGLINESDPLLDSAIPAPQGLTSPVEQRNARRADQANNAFEITNGGSNKSDGSASAAPSPEPEEADSRYSNPEFEVRDSPEASGSLQHSTGDLAENDGEIKSEDGDHDMIGFEASTGNDGGHVATEHIGSSTDALVFDQALRTSTGPSQRQHARLDGDVQIYIDGDEMADAVEDVGYAGREASEEL